MATASPTPMAAGPIRRTSQRQALRRPGSRTALTKSESQVAAAHAAAAANGNQSQQYHDESSDDEIPMPSKLSALTKAILNDGVPEGGARGPSPPRTRRRTSALNASAPTAAEERRHLRSGSVQANDVKSSKPPSPARSREPSPVRKRVIKLSNTPQSLSLSQMPPGHRRSTSVSRTNQRQQASSRSGSRDVPAEEKPEAQQQDVNTPAQSGRVVRIVTESSGNRSRVGSAGPSSNRSNFDRSAVDKSALEADHDQSEVPETVGRQTAPASQGSASRYQSSSAKSKVDDMMNPQSSMRVKRVGRIPGSFLSGPARRGRRRQSEEDAEENGEGDHQNLGQEAEAMAMEGAPEPHGIHEFNSGSPVSGNAAARAIHRRHASSMDMRPASPIPSPRGIVPEPKREANEDEMEIRIPRVDIPSRFDQENAVPASYKRQKAAVDDILESGARRPLGDVQGPAKDASPERKPLASIAQNTPHRPAPPPPPKMSVLEAATSTTGAATTTQAKQRRNVLKVNGKGYTRLNCLGRGGSAKVYSVTAENGSMFALKRVSLENTDEASIRGFLGEIELLEKLSKVSRVVNLHAHELNREKKVLSLVMEMGEVDLNRVMGLRQSSETAKFDSVFVRYHWKEMLECLQAVHENDIVHSDLKPANFVLVKGQLKLIDFGIADAIRTDETVNVHRENQIGTPNYMSPESLMDANNPRGGRMPGRARLVKVGKPSDVWSLGCILYQMVYGVPPFGHIANHMARCQAIINWDHAIEFPQRAMGGVPVPPSLIRTMRRCLNREHHMRPTCEELLHPSDPFLYPMELNDRALPIDEELLGRIIQSVVTRCRERMPTEAESVSVWPQAYWTSIRKAMANRQ